MARWWSSAAAAAWLLVATLAPASPALADEPASTRAPGPVVVVGVPDLRWQDVSPLGTPTLWRLAGESSTGAMTDQSGEGDARRAAGWVTLNTGSRAVARVQPHVLPDPEVPAQLQALRSVNRTATYHSQVGALGDALHRAGRTVAAVDGSGAVLGAMTSAGRVDSRAPSVAVALEHADVVVVELPQLYDVARQDAVAVRSALAAIDDAVRTVLQELPSPASLLVAGVSDAAQGPADLHVAMARGPRFGPGRLTSASTGRAGVVQLIDVAPTVLWLVGAPVPAAMLGVHWTSVSELRVPTGTRVSRLVDLDERSVAQVRAQRWYYRAVGAVALLYVVGVVIAWGRRRAPPRQLSAVVASIPVASWLVQLVPWWRVGGWLLAPLSVGAAAAIGLATTALPWPRNGRWRIAAGVGAVTAAVIVVDAATGSPLSLDAPFGDNPIIAGRFHGVGNVALALLGSGTLLFAAAAVTAAGLRRGRAAAVVFGLGAAAVAVDGYPGLGDDLGGVLALLPSVAVLGLAVSGVRVSLRYAAAVLAVTVTTVAAFALVDHARPPSQQTHLGRFVGQLADGSAGSVVARKLASSLATFSNGWPRWITLVWVVLALVAYAAHRRGRLRVPEDVDQRTAGGLVAALVVLGILGAGLNDSGLAITAFVLFVGAPALVSLVEPVRTASPAPSASSSGGRPQARPATPSVASAGR